MTIGGAEQDGTFTAENVRISWSVSNAGPFSINDEFNVEVRFDGTTLAQWTSQGLAINSFIFVDDAADLLDGMRIAEGVHEFELVIDPLDSVVETSETDNTLKRVVTFSASDSANTSPDLLPNLVPAAPNGKTEPLFVSSHPDDPLSGKLSVDQPAYFTFGGENHSIQYVTRDVEVDLYFDGMLARRLIWAGLGAGEALKFEAGDLREFVEISPGPHTLRLVMDPLDRIPEADETDNTYEVQLVWGVEDPSAPAVPSAVEPPVREPTIRANLMPFRPFGWSSGITASVDNLLVPPGTDGWLEASKATRVDFAFTNASRFSLPLTDQLEADVLLDGVFLERRNFTSGSSNVGLVWEDDISIPANAVTRGEHTIRVVLDPRGLFDEISEQDNVFERSFTWHDEPDPEAETEFFMADEEISGALAPIFNGMRREVRPVTGPGTGERDWTPEIRAAGRAIYYLLTGRDVEQEGYALHFLPTREFKSESIAACMSRWITMTTSEYEETFEQCSGNRGEIGFKTRSNGQIHLFVDLGLSPLDALGTYLHELGHGLQDLSNPGQTEMPFSVAKRGMFEAQAQIFEAAGWRAVEEFMDEKLSLFPDVQPARDRFDFTFDLRRSRGTEHDVGYRLLWAEALSDPGDLGFDERLRAGEKLDSASAMVIYQQMVDLRPFQVEGWAANLLARTDLMDEFRQIASQQFVENLPAESVGHNALQDATWTAP